MTYAYIRAERSGPVFTVTLNRPEKRNALIDPMLDELEEATREAGDDDSISVIVVKGAGSSFCAGRDMTAGGSVDDVAGSEAFIQRINHRWITLRAIPKPVITQVHGYCLGLGTFICIGSDMTVVADDARIGVPSVPGDWNADWWVWRIGAARAKQMVFCVGAQMSGEQAVRWGFANMSFPAERLDDEVSRLAQWIAKTPLQILRLKKQAIDQVVDAQGFRVTAGYTAGINTLVARSRDFEGVTADIRARGLKAAISRYQDAAE